MDSMEVITVWVSKSLLPGELSRADLFLGAVFSISLCKDFINQSCPFLIPRWLQGKGLEQGTHIKTVAGMPSFSLAFS
jgi:hypothetical protein